MTTDRVFYKEKKINSINTITCIVEENFMGNFSILIFDEEGGVWVEKFANNKIDAVNVAEKLFSDICNEY